MTRKKRIQTRKPALFLIAWRMKGQISHYRARFHNIERVILLNVHLFYAGLCFRRQLNEYAEPILNTDSCLHAGAVHLQMILTSRMSSLPSLTFSVAPTTSWWMLSISVSCITQAKRHLNSSSVQVTRTAHTRAHTHSHVPAAKLSRRRSPVAARSPPPYLLYACEHTMLYGVSIKYIFTLILFVCLVTIDTLERLPWSAVTV